MRLNQQGMLMCVHIYKSLEDLSISETSTKCLSFSNGSLLDQNLFIDQKTAEDCGRMHFRNDMTHVHTVRSQKNPESINNRRECLKSIINALCYNIYNEMRYSVAELPLVGCLRQPHISPPTDSICSDLFFCVLHIQQALEDAGIRIT
jgi:hypothetical protein